jgi:hypothetical protein
MHVQYWFGIRRIDCECPCCRPLMTAQELGLDEPELVIDQASGGPSSSVPAPSQPDAVVDARSLAAEKRSLLCDECEAQNEPELEICACCRASLDRAIVLIDGEAVFLQDWPGDAHA